MQIVCGTWVVTGRQGREDDLLAYPTTPGEIDGVILESLLQCSFDCTRAVCEDGKWTRVRFPGDYQREQAFYPAASEVSKAPMPRLQVDFLSVSALSRGRNKQMKLADRRTKNADTEWMIVPFGPTRAAWPAGLDQEIKCEQGQKRTRRPRGKTTDGGRHALRSSWLISRHDCRYSHIQARAQSGERSPAGESSSIEPTASRAGRPYQMLSPACLAGFPSGRNVLDNQAVIVGTIGLATVACGPDRCLLTTTDKKDGTLSPVLSAAGSSQPGVVLSASGEHINETKRGLSPRHVQLMAIGGTIGTGLWVGVGSVLSEAGPLSLVLEFMFWGLLFVWPLNLCVAEMCAYLPIRGTIFELASRFVDPALGFAMGWTYFVAGTMLVCVEYSAVATVMQYWAPDINPAAWIALAMGLCFLLNVVAVKWYGESEFIMASTKILLLFGLCLLTLITMSGGNPKHDAYGFRNWGNGNAMHPYYTDGSIGRFLGWWSTVLYAGFVIAGPDMIALAAGEIQNPSRTIPRVAQLIFYRLVGFYVVGALCVGILTSSRDPGLLSAIENGEPGAAASPWVIVIKNLNIKGLPDLINACMLLSGWSCGNAYLYSSSRTLYGLARGMSSSFECWHGWQRN
ncbi:Uu.00g133090.m01.CDS01 [Anthostomella pinea]|uniref:Uu.00g133090.m01.CDS01 n=1 Tax=Anthostomella pinea TaxID=933095 RepID=A0AAI8VTT4_9PEZI|nr:Uu.00g133090.m01.CDS01 [Anthostomella pinea]